jgi:predicted MFS family arabinose efflux permease
VVKVMWAGIVALYACLVIGLLGRSVEHYWVSLVFLGIGWNFLFVGATTLLVTQYREGEKGLAEGLNDFTVFALAAIGSLSSGSVLHWFGWHGLLQMAAIPLVVLTAAMLFFARRQSRVQLA